MTQTQHDRTQGADRNTEKGAGYGRDEDLERARMSERPAGADLDATAREAGRRPVIHVSPDPDAERGGKD